jgi:flagellar hook-associated protein 2
MAIKLQGLSSGLDTYTMIEELTSAQSVKKDNLIKEQKSLEYKQKAWSDINYKLYGFYSDSLSNMRFTGNYNVKKISVSDDTKAKISGSSTAVNGLQTLEINSLAKSGYLTGAKLSENNEVTLKTKLKDLGIQEGKINLTVGKKSTNIDISEDMTIEQFTTALSLAGVNASFDEKNQRMFISSKDSGKENDFSLVGLDKNGTNALDTLGIRVVSASEASYYEDFLNSEADQNSEAYKYAKEMSDAYKEYKSLIENNSNDQEKINELKEKLGYKNDGTGASRIEGTDAEINLNGAVFKSNSNNFEINGLSINVLGLTDKDDSISITASSDTDAIYDKIVNFIEEYNSVIKEMDKLYNAPATSYKPLTDEEESALSDKQLEKWEEKLYDSALRKDSSLSGIINSMKSIMTGMYDVGGEKMSLSSFGINTQSYFEAKSDERGVLHIDGNSNDKLTAGKTDKLREMIAKDPEKVVEFFSDLSNKLYNTINNKMKSTSLSSAYTVYNDKQMAKKQAEYDKKIAAEEEKINKLTEKYEKQFATMEKMLAQMQSNMNSLSSLFGGF